MNSQNPSYPTRSGPSSLNTSHPTGSGLNPAAAPYPPSVTSNNICSDNIRSVFLQTARVVLHNPNDPRVSLEVHLLLDSGSQKSYISARARDLLSLDNIEEQSLSIATFGTHRGSVKVCPIVNVAICLKGYPSMSLSLYVMPTICEPLVGQPITACENHPHLKGLELANFSAFESPIGCFDWVRLLLGVGNGRCLQGS